MSSGKAAKAGGKGKAGKQGAEDKREDVLQAVCFRLHEHTTNRDSDGF